jgi:carboxymethylenebutenolidase
VARRFAKVGCVALVPDVSASARPDQISADLNAAVEALAKQPAVGATRYGVCGLGWGGEQALRLAAANPKLRAAVVYYAATPMPPEIMKTTNAAILGQYASRDTAVDDTIPALERVMMEAGKTFEKQLYQAGPGFNDDTGDGYNEAAAVAAWSATVGWFDPHLPP